MIHLHTMQSRLRTQDGRCAVLPERKITSCICTGVRRGRAQMPVIPGNMEIRIMPTPTMPNARDSMLRYASCCFPHASPVLELGAGKQETASEGHFKHLISLSNRERAKGFEPSTPTLARLQSRPRPKSKPTALDGT